MLQQQSEQTTHCFITCDVCLFCFLGPFGFTVCSSLCSFVSGDTSNIAVAGEAGCMMPDWSHPVSGADISAATPKACPDCRAVIHSVLRYGRLLRYSELKVLERKHAIQIDSRIARLSTPPNVVDGESEQQAWINRFCQLGSLLTLVRKGPTQKVCCSGCSF